ncbi:unnamed protein product [Scytosiphon promiscuus]
MDFLNKARDSVEAEAGKLQKDVQGQVETQIDAAMGKMGLKQDKEVEEEAGTRAAGGGGGGHKKPAGGGGGGGGKHAPKHGGPGPKHGGGGGGGGGGKGGPKHAKRAVDIPDDEFDEEIAGGIKADVRMFSGCEDVQTSADVHDVAKFGLPDATGAGGACTNAILANVKDSTPDSWMSLLKGMRSTLKEKKFKQVPQLATSKKLDIHSPFSLAGGDGGKHKALLIGINYTGGKGELKGCHNDVSQMKEYIIEHGYPAEGGNLKIVSDDGENEEPTKENILKAISLNSTPKRKKRWLVQGAKAGDSLFMHYSGHGGSVKDKTGDEEDCKDETMIPVDYMKAGQIKDDQILEELVMPLPEGVVLSVVMDCCHSGSILDLPYSFDAKDGALELVEAGGSGVVAKKKNFNVKKMHKAQGKK